jgi:hypothetical protein
MAHEDFKDMLAAQALNALEVAEVRDLEAHLQGCAECRSQLTEWEDTAATLAFASLEARLLEPSPQLRGRILEAVRANGPGKSAEDGYRPQASNVVPLKQHTPAWSSAQTWGAIAAGMVITGLVATLLVLWTQNRQARRELTALTVQVRDAQQQLIQQRQVMEIVAAPGTRMTELTGTKVMPGAHATIAYDKNGHAVLMAKGLPPPPAGKAYQLWFIAGGKPMPGKVFTTDVSGSGTLNDQIPAEALNSAVFAITLEPKEGVAAPTLPIYLSSGA